MLDKIPTKLLEQFNGEESLTTDQIDPQLFVNSKIKQGEEEFKICLRRNCKTTGMDTSAVKSLYMRESMTGILSSLQTCSKLMAIYFEFSGKYT